jgi:hypothetical protein
MVFHDFPLVPSLALRRQRAGASTPSPTSLVPSEANKTSVPVSLRAPRGVWCLVEILSSPSWDPRH